MSSDTQTLYDTDFADWSDREAAANLLGSVAWI
jgi:hypothetical protein